MYTRHNATVFVLSKRIRKMHNLELWKKPATVQINFVQMPFLTGQIQFICVALDRVNIKTYTFLHIQNLVLISITELFN